MEEGELLTEIEDVISSNHPIFALLNEEQKKKVVSRLLEIKINVVEMRIARNEKILEARKKFLATLKEIQVMLK
ncbi:MAG TPA: hypothetical protein VGK06_13190 [Methanosarcina sp.]|jgi:hypothetical protein